MRHFTNEQAETLKDLGFDTLKIKADRPLADFGNQRILVELRCDPEGVFSLCLNAMRGRYSTRSSIWIPYETATSKQIREAVVELQDHYDRTAVSV